MISKFWEIEVRSFLSRATDIVREGVRVAVVAVVSGHTDRVLLIVTCNV